MRRNDPLAHRWDVLGTYNAERARGIVHTPEWDEAMRREQEAFNQENRFLAHIPPDWPGSLRRGHNDVGPGASAASEVADAPANSPAGLGETPNVADPAR